MKPSLNTAVFERIISSDISSPIIIDDRTNSFANSIQSVVGTGLATEDPYKTIDARPSSTLCRFCS
jgi:hypothetical protein